MAGPDPQIREGGGGGGVGGGGEGRSFGPPFDLKKRGAPPSSLRGNSEMAYYLVPLPIIIA